MWRDKVDFLLVGVVGAYVGQVRRVLVHGRFRGVGLQSLGNAVEIKLVGVAFAVHLGHDVLVVVVAQRTAQLVVVHVGLALALASAPRHLVWVRELELSVATLPRDAAGVRAVSQQLQQKLPQLDLAAACGEGGQSDTGGMRESSGGGRGEVGDDLPRPESGVGTDVRQEKGTSSCVTGDRKSVV